MNITAWSIINNEIDFLPLIVPYHLQLFDNWFILDTGSTDGSYEYLKETLKLFTNVHVAKYPFSFIPEYEVEWRQMKQPFPEVEVRNYAIDCTKGIFTDADWMVQIDGDEVFLPETRKLIERYHQDSNVSFISHSTINPVLEIDKHPIEHRFGKKMIDPHCRIWRNHANVHFSQNPEIKDNKQFHCIPTCGGKHLYRNRGNVWVDDKIHFHLHWLYGKKLEVYNKKLGIHNRFKMIEKQIINEYGNLLPHIYWEKRNKWLPSVKEMIQACLDDINAEEWEGGGAIYASSIGDKRDFIEGLEEICKTCGYDSLTEQQMNELCDTYSKA